MDRELIIWIENEIHKHFPSVEVTIEEISDRDEFFINIDKKDIYESDEYLQFITMVGLDVLMKEGISNVFFSYEEALEKSVIPAKEITRWAETRILSECDDVKVQFHNTETDVNTWISDRLYQFASGVKDNYITGGVSLENTPSRHGTWTFWADVLDESPYTYGKDVIDKSVTESEDDQQRLAA